ncbi:MAG: prepilin-type N-terminal cleavage/methylation domain-containing protein [Verrucomicrobiota bacterium]
MNDKQNTTASGGFTLIELLVVFALNEPFALLPTFRFVTVLAQARWTITSIQPDPSDEDHS